MVLYASPSFSGAMKYKELKHDPEIQLLSFLEFSEDHDALFSHKMHCVIYALIFGKAQAQIFTPMDSDPRF